MQDLRDWEPAAMGLGSWTLEQLSEVRVASQRGVTLAELKQIFDRPRRQLRKVLLYMGCSPVRAPQWSEAEEERLRMAFAAGGREAAARALPRLDQDIHWRLVLLGLVRGKSRLDQPWEARYLVQAVAAHRPIDEMVYSVQANPQAIYARALALGCCPYDLAACSRASS